MASISRSVRSVYWEAPALPSSLEEDLSDIAECLRGTDLDGTLPLASEYFSFPEFEDSVLRCWDCGNSVDADCCISQEIEYGGFPLRVPVCSVCYPIPVKRWQR
jgi:hypothetical protein